ncbi:A-kinase anchor protein 6 [Bagarius yarrelli]|uniref:A-kinase anchor protein 6 n=1 Tax=Bagarius yarrelli TaxID=175774 RepID=A0A556U990_BAGYA|nr:A-kinase anchor protein 6 [Bagarius yarrelli]
MSIAVSPVASEAASPMITSVTPTLEYSAKHGLCGPDESEERVLQSPELRQRNQKPPPLHTGADWKVVLHLPEIETWLRATAERVRNLTQSVQQDSLNRHVDVHLVQLKDICEDISDHVEQVHALLETEFSLKLLSYSVNIIVDIRTVQLLWHQLRVSVLVLKERLLQGLQDSNGNYTRQTDILQAFSQDHDQARLDSLTEVDDSGQLIIKCSQDYFSLDCGITAFELSDYSPGEDPENRSLGQDPCTLYPELERDFPELLQSVDLLTLAASRQSQELSSSSNEESIQLSKPTRSNQDTVEEETRSSQGSVEEPTKSIKKSVEELTKSNQSPVEEPNNIPQRPVEEISESTLETQSMPMDQASYTDTNMQEEINFGLSKRPLQGSHSHDISPTQPSFPKKPMYQEESSLQYQADISRSTPSLLDLPDRSKFWLDLKAVDPSSGSQSEENLYIINAKNRQTSQQKAFQKRRAQMPLHRTVSVADQESDTEHSNLYSRSKSKQVNSVSSTSPPSSGEETSNHEPHESSSSLDDHLPNTDSLWIMTKQGSHIFENNRSPKDECWYGSEEFLALPAQLKKTEMLASKLESLAQAIPPRALQQSVQDVDNWELTEANTEWETNTQFFSPRPNRKHFSDGRFSTSSSDVAPSVDGSIESGPLSDLVSEDEGGWCASKSQKSERITVQPEASRMMLQCTPLIEQLLEDIQHQENYQDIWEKLEGFISKLDVFICWLRKALESTEDWTPPQADIENLRRYLETHLSFKLNVDSHCALKDSLLEEGRQLLELITCHKSGLQDMLQMIAHQWQELQRQIRRQHSWMLRTLDAIKAQILTPKTDEDPKSTEDPDPHASSEVQQYYKEPHRDILDQISVKLGSQHYCSSSSGNKNISSMSKSNSLSEFESEYQGLWDWLMDMESIATDSHELMMSEEQQQHLYKGNRVEMAMWLPKKTQLLGWAESLKRSSIELPDDFEERMTALRVKWDQLEKILGAHVEVRTNQLPVATRGLLSPGTSSMVSQLELKIKELKSWLRDTELFIFNLSLREDKRHTDTFRDAHQAPLADLQCDPQPNSPHDSPAEPQAVKQLERFKTLCMEVRGRRKGMASVLRLCQRLLEGPEEQSSEAERQSLQLLQVNLERRWEAIVMQVLQWQNHLKHTLGRDQVPGNLIEPSVMELRSSSEDSWEWDEMDMTIDNMESQESDEKQHLEKHQEEHLSRTCPTHSGMSLNEIHSNPPAPRVYQVFSLHSFELYQQPQFNQKVFSNIQTKPKEKQPLLKSLSKDSSFSSVESLPDIIAGLVSGKQGLLTDSARRSESESGIVSEGDTETTANSEICLLYQSDDPKLHETLNPLIHPDSPCIDRVLDEDLDKALEHSNKFAELGDNLTKKKKGQQYFIEKKKREESEEGRQKHKNEAVEIFINGRCLSPESEDEGHETAAFSAKCDDDGKVRKSTQLSQGSSLDSLYAVGELFPSAKETLTRSVSLESWLAPCKSSGGADSQSSQGDLVLATETTGELSKRTLELLKRLENIQTPLAQKITRSISDITLPSSSLHLPGRGPRSEGAPSSINESLAASLTELSSIDDSSIASEDLAVQKKRCMAANSNASFRKHSRSQQLTDETDASVSMVVNVSCNSACTDDEDDSDLLSSSTLTLTEEELGIKDDEDSSITSEEEYIEGAFALGLEYIKDEFKGWVKPRVQNRERNEVDLGDELQCGTLSKEVTSPLKNISDHHLLNRTALTLLESNTNTKNGGLKKQEVDSKRVNSTRNYMSSFVDDMENGNVDNTHIKGEDEDELLREEGSLFTKKGKSLKECYSTDDLKGDLMSMVVTPSPSSCEQVNLQTQEYSLEGQLKGELPCHSSPHPPSSLSPVEECATSHLGMQGAAHIGSQKQSASFQNKDDENHRRSSPDCCGHQPFSSKEEKREDVHNFVMEIIDMTSVALKTKDVHAEHPQEPSSPATTSQIKDKVLEHSHRPINLRKGDFYSYLSLSSHDSDCGEVSTCTEEKSSTPVLSRTPEIHDEEPLFAACTEEVYLGPPLCYSMSISKRPMRRSTKLIDSLCPLSQAPPPTSNEYQKAHSISPGRRAGTQPQCHNEAPYLNPLPCETVIDTVECFADTKMLESNISPVMTKIRVSCSSTNPLKEESRLNINPKINCPLIRKNDRDERGDASRWMKQKNVRKGRISPQEAKSTHKQLVRSERSAGPVETDRRSVLSESRSGSAVAVKSGVSSRPQAKCTPGVDGCTPAAWLLDVGGQASASSRNFFFVDESKSRSSSVSSQRVKARVWPSSSCLSLMGLRCDLLGRRTGCTHTHAHTLARKCAARRGDDQDLPGLQRAGDGGGGRRSNRDAGSTSPGRHQRQPANRPGTEHLPAKCRRGRTPPGQAHHVTVPCETICLRPVFKSQPADLRRVPGFAAPARGMPVERFRSDLMNRSGKSDHGAMPLFKHLSVSTSHRLCSPRLHV